MGAYPEDVLRNISNGYYWVEPNKYQKKISVLNPEGVVFKDEIDRIIVLDNYSSIAYLKNKAWYIYDILHQLMRLNGEGVERVGIDALNNYMPDVFIVTDKGANGLYDALQDKWLIPLSVENTKIEHCQLEFLRITQGAQMRYYDYNTKIVSPLYDYVCEGIDYQTQFLCLFAGDKMWILDKERQIRKSAMNRWDICMRIIMRSEEMISVIFWITIGTGHNVQVRVMNLILIRKLFMQKEDALRAPEIWKMQSDFTH